MLTSTSSTVSNVSSTGDWYNPNSTWTYPGGVFGQPVIGPIYNPPTSIPYTISPELLQVLQDLVRELELRRLANEARNTNKSPAETAADPILPPEPPSGKRKIELDD